MAGRPPKHPEYRWFREPSKLIKIQPLVVVNRVKVLEIGRKLSHFYLQPGMKRRAESYSHLTGEIKCLCLVCKRKFTTRYNRIHPNNPAMSLWSCGCQKRPWGTGYRAVARKKAVEEEAIRRKERGLPAKLLGEGEMKGRPPEDLTERRFGLLEPFSWMPKKGWLCLCHGCGEGVVVKVRALLTGTRTSCRRCRKSPR